jgi:hypothetical protein
MSKRGSISDDRLRDPVSGVSLDLSGVSRDLVSDASRDPVSGGSETGDSPNAREVCAAGGPGDDAGAWTCASHDALFRAVDEIRCDACGCELEDPEIGDEDDLGGRGVYVWTRGDEARLEEAPLCASCASAIGMTALARWEIEEEEG